MAYQTRRVCLLTHVTNLHIVKLPTFIDTEVLVQLGFRTDLKDYRSQSVTVYSVTDAKIYKHIEPCTTLASPGNE